MIARILALLILAAPLPAWAHKLKVFAMVESGWASGSVYFAGGDPAAGLTGLVLDDKGGEVARTTSDSAGKFAVMLPDGRPYRLRFETVDGHAAEAALNGAPAAAESAASAPVNADLDAALARQLRPLREQIDALESRTRFSDLVGGLGLIIGLFGAAAWVSARRKEAGK